EIEASGLWPGPVVTEINPEERFWQAEPEHQDYLQRHLGGYSCHFIRPSWRLPSAQAFQKSRTAEGRETDPTLVAIVSQGEARCQADGVAKTSDPQCRRMIAVVASNCSALAGWTITTMPPLRIWLSAHTCTWASCRCPNKATSPP